MSKNLERKILSFSTTMRNPERMGKFLAVLQKYENQILNHNVIMNIVKDILSARLYKPMPVSQDKKLKELYNNKDYVFSNEELEHIIEISPQKHKEAGFNEGWESRFDTWYKLSSEFGFCYYAKGDKILISESGNKLINAYYDNTTNKFKDDYDYDNDIVSALFLNALSKYESGNPYKRNLNHNNPLRLLLNLLTLLKKNNQQPLHIKEIPILLCWQNSNYNDLYTYIFNMRDEIYRLNLTHFSYSDEYIYEKCLELLESENTNRFKLAQLIKESFDDYMRKMRITGLISVRGNGRFIDINNNEKDKINYILNLTTNFEKDYLDDSQDNKFEYFKYVSTIDTFLITTSPTYIASDDVKISKLIELSKEYTSDTIKKELIVCGQEKTPSKDELFKIIDKPLRLEFLVAIFLTQNFNTINVIPNYKADDEGIPIFTASGGKSDIIAFDNTSESYIEVSLIKNRSQCVLEMIPTERHLESYILSSNNNKIKFSVFVAPAIHQDSIRYAEFSKYTKQLDIICYSIKDFINQVEISPTLLDLNTN